eukprot:6925437-Pyramimonas_sp.AAC.1
MKTPCRLCPFSRDFLEKNDPFDPATRLRLMTIARGAQVDMANVEALHASMRRILDVLSTQVKTLDLTRASAEWIGQ